MLRWYLPRLNHGAHAQSYIQVDRMERVTTITVKRDLGRVDKEGFAPRSWPLKRRFHDQGPSPHQRNGLAHSVRHYWRRSLRLQRLSADHECRWASTQSAAR